MDKDKLQQILEEHKKWLDSNGREGEQANLREADLRKADLRGADLCEADLRWANLREANLREADLCEADLRKADLRGADLREVDLCEANLRGADLRKADLNGVIANSFTAFYHLSCPSEGSFIGFKKCKDNRIVKLLIPDDAKRSSATSRKCRCSKAKVLRIEDIDGNEVDKAESLHDENFVYRTGEVVEVQDFDNDRWNECSRGIHFFLTKEEAASYE